MEELNEHFVDNVDSVSSPETIIDSEFIELPMGKELTAQEIYPISASEKSSLSIIAGATGSGKTTLVTSFYHLLMSGAYTDDYLFAGSRTLAAFEKRAYDTRTTSLNFKVEMKRTPRGSIDSILHLRIIERVSGTYTNILLSDFSGEDFEDVSADIDTAVEDFQVVSLASSIIFLLDGEKIVCRKERLAELEQAINVLHTFWDAQLICKSTKIVIAISKYDVVCCQDDDSIRIFLSTLLDQITDRIPGLKGRCFLHCIASFSESESTPTLYGLKELINELITPLEPEAYEQATYSLTSQFNKWKGRRL